jgi:ribosomal protein S18 acetylase RimI-like enzyme
MGPGSGQECHGVAVRRAGLRDLDGLHGLDNAVFGAMAYPYFVLRQLLDLHEDCWFVAEGGGRLLGYVLAVPQTDDPHGWILGVAVLEKWRGNGVGTALTRTAIRELAGRGVAELKLTVEPQNTGAIEFYRRLGFRAESELARDYLGPGEHRVIMVRDLAADLGLGELGLDGLDDVDGLDGLDDFGADRGSDVEGHPAGPGAARP